jgi:hypothetical protein
MSSLESRIDSAAAAAAAEIGPADIPPLRLRAQRSWLARLSMHCRADAACLPSAHRALTGTGTGAPHSRHRWPTPLAAAASVAAVLAGLVIVGHSSWTGTGGAWPASAAVSRAQARLAKQALDWYFPATGAQYTAGLTFAWTRQKILAADMGPCLAQAGFPQPPFSVPKRSFILHSGGSTQFPDLGQRLRTSVITPRGGGILGYKSRAIPKAQRSAYASAMRSCLVRDARPIWRLDKVAAPLAAIWLKKVGAIQSSPPVLRMRPAVINCLEAAGVPAHYAKRGGVDGRPLFAGFFAWMGRLGKASTGPGQVAREQRTWTPAFITCAKPTVALMERLQIAERSAFVRQHARQMRTIRRLVIDLLPRRRT